MSEHHLTCAVAVAELEDEVVGLRRRNKELEAQLVRVPKGRGNKKAPSFATIQDLHLELIRRTKFNQFDGEQVYRDLVKYRSFWHAVLLDRASPNDFAGLIKLKDLQHDRWNVDTLFVLADGDGAAGMLGPFELSWNAETHTIYDEWHTRMALGQCEPAHGRLITFRWR